MMIPPVPAGAKMRRPALAPHQQLKRAESALWAVPPDVDRDTWVKAIMGAKAAGLDFDTVDQWSSGGESYNAQDFKDVWRSVKSDAGVTEASLFAIAKERGWDASIKRHHVGDADVAPVETAAHRDRLRAIEAQRHAEQAQRQQEHDRAAALALQRWERARPAPVNHPYLMAKGVQAHGIRAEGNQLLIPAFDVDGKLHTLQTIGTDGSKRYQLDGSKTGHFHVIGKPDGVLVVCEGYATGASIHEATGAAVAVAFDAGGLQPVAQALHAKYPTLALVIAADDDWATATGNTGLESAKKAAKAIGGTVVVPEFPSGADRGTDFNDLQKVGGLGAVRACFDKVLKAATMPTTSETFPPLPESDDGTREEGQPPHPLARFVSLHKRPKAVRWVIPGVIEEGVVTIAGARGVGKTTAVLPLALMAAGLHKGMGPKEAGNLAEFAIGGNPLAPRHNRWRHVIYVSEHVEQVQRIIAGVVDCSGWGITWEAVEERLHVVEAHRLPIDDVVAVAGFYKSLTRVVDGVELLPLVVFDTQAACFAMGNENDNAEASNIMAALKQRFYGAPIWIVGHVAKANIGRSDVESLTARGAGAFEADAIQNLYLVTEGESRFLSIGKTRAEPRHGKELPIVANHATVTGVNDWGEPEDVTLRWASVEPMAGGVSRAEAREAAKATEEKTRKEDMREAVLWAVDGAHQIGHPLNRAGVRAKVTGKTDEINRTVDALMAEGWLHEVEVPKEMRTNINRKHFLVKLTTEEHDHFKATGQLPEAKTTTIPESWKKPVSMMSIPSVPGTLADGAKNGVDT